MSKTLKSIFYAIGSFAALCIFIAIMIVVAARDDDRFLLFSINKIEVNISSEVEIKNIKLQTNLPHSAIEFSSEDENIFMIEGNIIKPVEIGSGKLLAKALMGDKVYQNSVVVEVMSVPASDDDPDFGVSIYYKNSTYSLAGFNQDINLYLPGGSAKDFEAAIDAGYNKSVYFETVSGIVISVDNGCVDIKENVVTALNKGSSVVKFTNKNIGKFKTVKVVVSEVPLTDFVLDCESKITIEVGKSFSMPSAQFVPSFASEGFRICKFNIDDDKIIYFDTDIFIAKSIGQTQIVFEYGELKKTVQVIVVESEYELEAEFLTIDSLGRAVIRLRLFCGGEPSSIAFGTVGVGFVIGDIEYNTLDFISCEQDIDSSLGYDYIYKVSGELPQEFIVKFYLTENLEIFKEVLISI